MSRQCVPLLDNLYPSGQVQINDPGVFIQLPNANIHKHEIYMIWFQY